MLLLVGEEEIQLDAWLGLFAGGARAGWGGVLHAVPVPLAAAMQHGQDVRICILPDGQERRIHAAKAPGTEGQEYVDMLFIGEGSAPT
ncbi:hypothetical protein ACIGPN_28900 [Streptomyces afghaniensis]|uniref:hypothetical protein n=1 Tax=Streptomyces afghaniensis TaxID=66865 RepID=UPI0037CD50A5